MQKNNRLKRLATEIKRKIAIIIQRKMQDPRIKCLITISDIELSRDLSYAKIFVTAMENSIEKEKIIKILQDTSSFVRFLLGQSMRLRIVPELTFFYDDSLNYGIRISELTKKQF